MPLPRMTVKYKRARSTAVQNEIVPDNYDRDELYQRLNQAGWWWDSKAKEWVQFTDEPANEPTPLIMVRVWASQENIAQAVGAVNSAFANGYAIIQESDPYPCRPPKQRESRVYLQFVPTQGMTKSELIRENDPYAIEVEIVE